MNPASALTGTCWASFLCFTAGGSGHPLHPLLALRQSRTGGWGWGWCGFSRSGVIRFMPGKVIHPWVTALGFSKTIIFLATRSDAPLADGRGRGPWLSGITEGGHKSPGRLSEGCPPLLKLSFHSCQHSQNEKCFFYYLIPYFPHTISSCIFPSPFILPSHIFCLVVSRILVHSMREPKRTPQLKSF